MSKVTGERDGSGSVLRLALDPADLRTHPTEKIDVIASALAQGHRVELSPIGAGAIPPRLSPAAFQLIMDVVSVYLGGAFPAVVSIAIFPASVTAALVAAAAGGVGTAVAIWLFRKHASKSQAAKTPSR